MAEPRGSTSLEIRERAREATRRGDAGTPRATPKMLVLAALSASEFFQYKLQNDRFFGKSVFPNGKVETFPEGAAEPVMTVEYESEDMDPNKNVVNLQHV